MEKIVSSVEYVSGWAVWVDSSPVAAFVKANQSASPVERISADDVRFGDAGRWSRTRPQQEPTVAHPTLSAPSAEQTKSVLE